MVLAYSFGYLSQSSLLGSLRILETIIFALTCTYFLRRKSSYAIIRSGVSFSLLYTGILAIIQFILQQSAGGVWYWLGERTFDLTTPGIAAFSVDGTLILRSYATFAHPNVLGGYSLVMVVFLLFFKHAGTNPRVILFEKAGVIAGILAIILSMSRSSLMLLGLIGVVWCLTYMVTRKKQVLTLVMGVIALVVLSYTIVWQRLLSFSIQEQSVLVRRELIKETSIMIRDNPIFGVGVQNFLPTLTHYLPDSSPIAYFQPVHSMFLMILAETGFVGAGIFIVMVAVTIMKIQKSRAEDKAGKILLLVIFIALGIIDHYFYTLHQGQFLGAFLFAVLLM